MALTYRPSPDLIARARVVADREGRSLQGLIDHALADYLDRGDEDTAALIASLIDRNRGTLAALAEQ